MTKYNCEICKFSSINKTDYNRHIKTKKHIEKVNQTSNSIHIKSKGKKTENVYKCPFCENLYSQACSLAKHKKACGEKMKLLEIKEKEKEEIIHNIELSALKKENEILQKQNKRIREEAKEKEELLKKQNESYQLQLKTFAKLLESTVAPQTINKLSFVVNNFSSSPYLAEPQTPETLNESKTMSLNQLVVMYYNDGRLVKFIGDYIIKIYKKEKPSEQSMWNSDVSRMTYIINKCINKTENIWTYDKKGIQVKKIVIEPLLKYIKNKLMKYCEENSYASEEPELSRLKASVEIIQLINGGTLANDVVRYIAPEFSLNQIEGINDNKDTKIKLITGNDKNKSEEIDDSNELSECDESSDSEREFIKN